MHECYFVQNVYDKRLQNIVFKNLIYWDINIFGVANKFELGSVKVRSASFLPPTSFSDVINFNRIIKYINIIILISINRN